MKEGDIVKAALLQSDGNLKLRPVLLLKSIPPFYDWLVCGISSKLRHVVKDFDLLIDENHPDFKSSGLIMPGLIRLGFLATIPENKIEGVIGSISSSSYKTLISNLVTHLESKK